MSKKVAHLNMLVSMLDMVNRSDVSAKRWAVSFTAVFLALATQQQGFRIAYLACVPLVLLWYVDAQNYRKEALINAMFERVRNLPEESVDFSIDLEALPEAKRSMIWWMFSGPALSFYASMIAGVVVVDYFVF